MNKIQVGTVASPNICGVKSRVGSLANAGHQPGGGAVKIERHRLDHSQAAPRIQARSDHRPGGGNRKVTTLNRICMHSSQEYRGRSRSTDLFLHYL